MRSGCKKELLRRPLSERKATVKNAHAIIAIVFLASAMMLAQTTSTQSGSATYTHAQHHPDTSAPAQSGTSTQGSGMQMGNMHGTVSGHMAGMEADMQQMRTQVDKMRADAQKIKDSDTRAALMQNVALWQQFLDRMQHHMQMMGSGMMGQGISGTHGMHAADHGCGAATTSGGCEMMEGQKPLGNTTPPSKPQ